MTSIRIHLLGREYALRVEDGHDEATRRYAAALDERLRTFRTQFPSQLELTASMIVALGLVEEIEALRDALDAQRQGSEATESDAANALNALDLHLAAALARRPERQEPGREEAV